MNQKQFKLEKHFMYIDVPNETKVKICKLPFHPPIPTPTPQKKPSEKFYHLEQQLQIWHMVSLIKTGSTCITTHIKNNQNDFC